MEHAWLDSLSEDWPSQQSEGSPSDILPPLKGEENKFTSSQRGSASGIPRPMTRGKVSISDTRENSINILSERSANELITRQPRRVTSKLSQEVKPATEQDATEPVATEQDATRTVSNSTSGSVIQKSSPSKSRGQTPEWKRRLLQGNRAYGEQRDLFCSAAEEGLGAIFRPPPPREDAVPEQDEEEEHRQHSYASSPPVNRQAQTPSASGDFEESDNVSEASPSPSPRKARNPVMYRLNEHESPQESSHDAPSAQDDSMAQSRGATEARDFAESPSLPEAYGSRKVSGQTDLNEDFSAISIAKRDIGNGKIDFTPHVKPHILREKLERLRVNQLLFNHKNPEQATTNGHEQTHASRTYDSTEAFERDGGFINTQRGDEAHGSFMNRMMSSALGTDTSEMLPEDSLQASTPKQFPSVRSDNVAASPTLPSAPYPSPQKARGGSPLKLFGPYDTFTNQTLLRRISQFEDPRSNSSRQSLDSIHEESPSRANQAFVASPEKAQRFASSAAAQSRSVSQFGLGDLDGFEFSKEMSQGSIYDSELEGDKENMPPEEPDSPVGTFPEQQRGRSASPPADGAIFVERLRPQSQSSKASRPSTRGRAEVEPGTPARRDFGSDSKRPRTTPSKDPTPKRRRTLHRSDIAYGRDDTGFDSAQLSHLQMQSIMGKKRKDARPGDQLQMADASILAGRQIINPRSGHSRRSSSSTGSVVVTSPSKAKAYQQSKNLAIDAMRKPSIRTQDFLDEAGKIMAMIRNQVRPPGLASMEESEAEYAEDGSPMEDSFQESTKEPFSRPPSREGRPVARVAQKQEDPELVRHLKKYQELSDMGDIISSSIRSVGLAKDAIHAAREVESHVEESTRSRTTLEMIQDQEEYSDPPNLRISGIPGAQPHHDGSRGDFLSNSSAASNRTIPTGSSRCSDSRKTIAPQSVSHLIPDQVGSMHFDRNQQIWVKSSKSPPKQSRRMAPSVDSEDDPFGSIQDLTVDMTNEMRNLRFTSPQKQQGSPRARERETPTSGQTPRSRSARGFVTLSPDAAVTQSMISQARDELNKLEDRNLSNMDEEVEHEISIHEGRHGHRSSPSRRRNLTISFSSPIASIIQDVAAEDLDTLEDDEGSSLDLTQEAAKSTRFQSLSKPMRKKALSRSRNTARVTSRHVSVSGQPFMPRPVSRIDERDEDESRADESRGKEVSIIENSLVAQGSRRASVSVILNTPGKRAFAAQNPKAGAVIADKVGRMSLSPLSDFTMHQNEQSFGFEVSYVLGERNLVTGDASQKVMSATIRDLVDRLGEAEPVKPWEEVVELDLSDKRLSSLHKLDEFCGKLVCLDASNNALSHLDGIPGGIRQLRLVDNRLSEMTAWNNLANLQYLDVSGNDITSLSGLRQLVHLRSLRADNNQLTSLDGIYGHDGLLSIRARDNPIRHVDFEGSMLNRLTEVDLAGNEIEYIGGLDQLESLTTLKLQRNRLEVFELPSEGLSRLRYLDVTNNRLTSLDIQGLPRLSLLHADRNRLTTVTGFHRARHLDSLSLREQNGESPLDVSFLSTAYEVRKLFLSGNKLSKFDPQVDFLNLQLLELANCGIQALTRNLGQLMPNIRTLNINFNAISDLSPLRYIPRMKKLLAAGNRVTDLLSAAEVLSGFPDLKTLDLRDNPVTMGFYPPIRVLVQQDKNAGGGVFEMPEGQGNRDGEFRSRLDEGTAVRRRFYEVGIVGGCARLRKLDGLALEKKKIFRRDWEWGALVREGMVPADEEDIAPRQHVDIKEAAREDEQ